MSSLAQFSVLAAAEYLRVRHDRGITIHRGSISWYSPDGRMVGQVPLALAEDVPLIAPEGIAGVVVTHVHGGAPYPSASSVQWWRDPVTDELKGFALGIDLQLFWSGWAYNAANLRHLQVTDNNRYRPIAGAIIDRYPKLVGK